METDDLPSEFDVVILGTGLTETIAAAAFSRIGLKVLHLDRNNYYGGSYANFNLQGIEEWKKKNEDLENVQSVEHELTDNLKQMVLDGNRIISLPCEKAQAHSIKTNFHVRQRTSQEKVVAEVCRVKRASESERRTPVDLSEFTITTDSSTKEAKSENVEGQSCPDKSSAASPQSETEKCQALSSECAGDNRGSTGQSEINDSNSTPAQVESEGKDLKEGETDKAAAAESVLKEDEVESKSSSDWTLEAIQDDWRKFCFDLSPRVLYCSGDLVELLIQSDVARYCEFRTVSRVLTLLNESLQQVPCSRADVFSSKIVSLIEKRLMMKFLQFAADFESHPAEYEEYKEKPFVEFLKSKKLTANIQHFVRHAIAMVSDVDSTEHGLRKTQRFLRSLGRYGNTAFLFSLYGSGELPQAFSRLSAVFGGTYCLMMSASHIIADEENKCCGVISTTGKKISCKYLVAEASYLPSTFVQYPSKRRTSRAIFITDKSICPCKDTELSLLNFECNDGTDKPVMVMELPPSACVCPKGLYVVHLIRELGSEDPEKDFVAIKEKLFADDEGSENEKPRILWSVYFSHDDLSQASLTPEAVGNVFVTAGGGDGCIDMERTVAEAKQIFLQVCPDEEFLPKPPNPEDIIYVDDEEAAATSGPGEFESSADMEEGNDDKKEEEGKENSDQDQESAKTESDVSAVTEDQ